MNISIYSKRELEKLAGKPFVRPTALISIDDVGADLPKLQYKPQHILRLEFDDIYISDIDYENCGEYAFRIFTVSQARQIADFVYRYKSETEAFICQCRFGKSRSAAVCAAIKEHFDRNGIDIFADERYSPNTFVFRTVFAALREKANELEG